MWCPRSGVLHPVCANTGSCLEGELSSKGSFSSLFGEVLLFCTSFARSERIGSGSTRSQSVFKDAFRSCHMSNHIAPSTHRICCFTAAPRSYGLTTCLFSEGMSLSPNVYNACVSVCAGVSAPRFHRDLFWVDVREAKLSYHNPKTILFTIS